MSSPRRHVTRGLVIGGMVAAATVFPAMSGSMTASAGPQCNRVSHSHPSRHANHNLHRWQHHGTFSGSNGERYENFYQVEHDYFQSTSNCNDAVVLAADVADTFSVE